MWTAQALYQLGRWDEAVEVLTRAQRYELHGYYELDLEAQLLLMEAERGQFEAANRRSAARAAADREIPDPGGLPLSPNSPSCRTTRSPRELPLSVRWRTRTFRSPYLGWALALGDPGGGGPGGARAVAALRGRSRAIARPRCGSPGADASGLPGRRDPRPLLHTMGRRSARVLARPSSRASKGRRIPISGLPQLPLSRPSRSPMSGLRAHARGRSDARAAPRPAEGGSRPDRGHGTLRSDSVPCPSAGDREARGPGRDRPRAGGRSRPAAAEGGAEASGEDAVHRRRRLFGPGRHVPRGRYDLTPREREVLRSLPQVAPTARSAKPSSSARRRPRSTSRTSKASSAPEPGRDRHRCDRARSHRSADLPAESPETLAWSKVPVP